jgi:uncharacterized cupin superfamily protein
VTKPHPLLRASEVQALPEEARPHPLDASLVRHTRSLGDAVGLEAVGLHLVRLTKGGVSSVFHRHHQEEEWVYVLSGRAIADIGDEKHEVAAGDFMGFAAGSVAHALRNPFDEDFVCLVGGNRLEFDICDYPRIGKRRYRMKGKRAYVDAEVLAKVGEKL